MANGLNLEMVANTESGNKIDMADKGRANNTTKCDKREKYSKWGGQSRIPKGKVSKWLTNKVNLKRQMTNKNDS
jgi:hypothetical protein